MRANARPRNSARRAGRDDGQVGIGTMIIFIATILTAAVAAGVVIDTTNNLQEKAQRTGLEATEQVANHLSITTVQGVVNSGSTSLDALNITVSLSPGSKQVDLGQMLIRVSNLTVARQLAYNSTGAGFNFSATPLRDPDNSFSITTPVLTSGDLVTLNVNLSASAANLIVGPRKTIEVTLQPEGGTRLATELRAPPSFTGTSIVVLR